MIGTRLLRLFLVAALSYLESGASRIWDWSPAVSFSHPQYLSRVDFILGHTRGWCENRQPQLAATLSHELVHTALRAVHNFWETENIRSLEAQVNDLLSGPYAGWEAEIEADRILLRRLLKPFAWRVRGYSLDAEEGR
jgi:hypothetical protein